ncbi:recombinase family protein [Palleronia rufa]|uniref:recombinase family protein n=1 Tax=Palleronia rufa TaxID=1530186 RepID=UPI0005634879|nr:recombinase family protein [Palleronia rufa]
MAILGYARVSTAEQNLKSQVDILTRERCDRIYTDTASGSTTNRPGLNAILTDAQEGDTIVVVSLDRFGRTVVHLLTQIEELAARKVGFRSLRESIDTRSAAGKLTLQLFAALSEFERARIRERTLAGLESARAAGRKGGRPSKINPKLQARAQKMVDAKISKEEIARALQISKATLYRMLQSAARSPE